MMIEKDLFSSTNHVILTDVRGTPLFPHIDSPHNLEDPKLTGKNVLCDGCHFDQRLPQCPLKCLLFCTPSCAESMNTIKLPFIWLNWKCRFISQPCLMSHVLVGRFYSMKQKMYVSRKNMAFFYQFSARFVPFFISHIYDQNQVVLKC